MNLSLPSRKLWNVVLPVLLGLNALSLVGCGQEMAPQDQTLGIESAITCGQLDSNMRLEPAQTLTSCGGKMLLAMQADGNLVGYFTGVFTPIWATATNDKPNGTAVMQGDGNFVIYQNGSAIWHTGTHGNPGARLVIQDDGNLVVYSADNRALWASASFIPGGRCGMSASEVLRPGQSTTSCNGAFTLVLQGDGNLVVYKNGAGATWASNTRSEDPAKKGDLAAMQGDGNFVIYNAFGQPLWASGTDGNPAAGLIVADDGTLEIKNRNHSLIWSSAPKAQADANVGWVPGSLVSQLSVKPYVEQNCSATTFPGWPYEAKRCSYSAGGISTSVTVANPPAERVARWIVDAANTIPALAELKNRDAGQYEEGLKAIGLAMLYQSSRIFPLSGGVIENMGSGYVNYIFENGVTKSCGSGCYCRINSLHRSDWCDYQAARGQQTRSACMSQMGSSGYTSGWSNQCLENHKRAWTSDVNEHFRAKAYVANYTVAKRCPQGACSPGQVVSAVRAGYGL